MSFCPKSCCCCSCYVSNPRQDVASFWCKPFRALLATFANWWIPRFCLVFCIVFYFIVAFGFKIGVHLSVYDLNENISAREIMWHMVNILWMPMVAFFCIEWYEDDKKTSKRDNIAYGVDALHRIESEDDIFPSTKNVVRTENDLVVKEKTSD